MQAIPIHESLTTDAQVVPAEQALQALAERKTGGEINLWGHGTTTDQPMGFFDGLLIDAKYADLFRTASPLDLDDPTNTIDKLRDWGHLNSQQVVLLAFTAPQVPLEDPMYPALMWMRGVIKKHDDRNNIVPSEWVYGVYDTNTNMVLLNPRFNGREVTSEDVEQTGLVENSSSVSSLFGDIATGVVEARLGTEVPPVFPEDDEIF